jgi:hypothetical protein
MNRRIRSVTLLACLAVLLLVAACAPAATSANTVQGIVWQWVSVTNRLRGKK